MPGCAIQIVAAVRPLSRPHHKSKHLLFPVAFTRASRVLDLGCGSGRDLNILRQAGYTAFGVDASSEMIAEAHRVFPFLADKIKQDELPQLTKIPDQDCDGVYAPRF
jgi:SAM-dependent methyltransferase